MLATHFFKTALVAFIVECAIGWACATAQERTDFPADARASYEKGRNLQKNGQLDEAIRAYEDAIKLGMEAFPRVHLQRASSNLDLKKHSTTIAQYTNFIEQKAAQVDRQRADDLQASAKKLASESAKTKEMPAGHFRFENAWTGAVTIAIGGVTYRLEAGEQKTIPAPAGSVLGQIQTGAQVQTATLEAGKAYRIR